MKVWRGGLGEYKEPMRNYCMLCLFLVILGQLSASENDVKIFDGQERTILYQTSSHAGQRQLEELLRMVPGGEKLSVLNAL